MVKEPQTLQAAVIYFSNPENCRNYIASRRWPNGVTCPVCGSTSVGFLQTQKRWQCSKRHPKRQFTAKTGTIFEDSPLGLDKWLVAMWLILNCKNGISSYELSRAIGVTQKTAWFMNHRIRTAMAEGTLAKLSGTVEADETFVGGKKRRQKRVGDARIPRGGLEHKTAVMGILERDGKVRAFPVLKVDRTTVQREVRTHVEPGSTLYTDGFLGYFGMAEFDHDHVAHHRFEFARGPVHVNTIEAFWTLLKRSLRGTYVSVEPFHLFRYCDEQTFRFNHRKGTDSSRLSVGVSQVSGRRLTYAKLTGKELPL